MKTIYKFITPIMAAFLLLACQNDNLVTLEGFNDKTEVELIGTATDVTLSQENSGTLLLQFAWTIPELYLSEHSLAANQLTHGLQISLDKEFASFLENAVSGTAQSYTGGSLNRLMNKLPVKYGAANQIYIRLATYAGKNIAPVYSNNLKVSVTPFEIDLSVMHLIDKTTRDVFGTLASASKDGRYTGFVSTTAWKNFYYMAGDGTIYASAPVPDNPFTLTADDNMWNSWMPGATGCYYMTMNLVKMEWSATIVNTLELKGAGSGSLTYSMSKGVWSGNITTTTSNAAVQLVGAGKRYDKASATDDTKATDFSFLLSSNGTGNSGTLNFYSESASQSFTIATAGTYNLTVDLNNAKELKYTLTESTVVGPTFPDQLYLHDKANTTAYYATLAKRSTDPVTYECFYPGAAWENFHLTSTTSLTEGTIYGYLPNGDANSISSLGADKYSPDDLFAFWFDNAVDRYYFIQADLESNKLSSRIINGFYATGNFNGWSTSANPLTYNAATKVWTATCNVTNTEYGIQILAAFNGEDIWGNILSAVSGSDGEIDWKARKGGADNIPVPSTGTYVITLDLSNSDKYTYTLVKQ